MKLVPSNSYQIYHFDFHTNNYTEASIKVPSNLNCKLKLIKPCQFPQLKQTCSDTGFFLPKIKQTKKMKAK